MERKEDKIYIRFEGDDFQTEYYELTSTPLSVPEGTKRFIIKQDGKLNESVIQLLEHVTPTHIFLE